MTPILTDSTAPIVERACKRCSGAFVSLDRTARVCFCCRERLHGLATVDTDRHACAGCGRQISRSAFVCRDCEAVGLGELLKDERVAVEVVK